MKAEARANYQAALANGDDLGAIYWLGRAGEYQTMLIIAREKRDLLIEASD